MPGGGSCGIVLPVNALYKAVKSVRLTVVLLLVITALSLLATLVPQGRPDAWYKARYSPALYHLITAVRLESFFSSVFFLVPVFLFTVNLGVCAVDRVVRREKSKAKRRHGPDLIHVGLLVLIAAALVTALGRHEKTWPLAIGEEAAITPSYTLRLLSFQFLKYPDGAPKEWISTVAVTREGREEVASFPIEVNSPLRLKGVSVYQASWDSEGILDLEQGDGEKVTATTGQGFQQGDSFWYFAEVRPAGAGWTAVFEEYKGQDLSSTRVLGLGDAIGPFTVRGISQRELTGLKVVHDPGLLPFLVALAMVLAGLGLTFIQRRGDIPA
jgi:cytochrome c biogenesis protein ResB